MRAGGYLMRIAMALLALALATTGCKKKENKPADNAGSGSAMVGSDMGSGSAGSGSAMGSDMGSGSAMAGSGAGSGSDAATTMTKKAGNCPSTVLGAKTVAKVKGKDVVVMVFASDKDAISSIQRRTEELVAEKKDGAGSEAGGHDQKGTHGGGAGICPLHVPDGATAKVLKEKNGASVTITPKDKPDELKKMIDERIAKAEAWVKENIKPADQGNQGGVGGGKGDHGGNHSGEGDSKGKERKAGSGAAAGSGGGKGTGGGGGTGTGGGSGAGSAKK
jgi:hypothetical protein